ncbi:MAG TPA: sigma 54-interacting transcriptional regulator [Candidatus Hydrogenedentes bacterium]|nr:sigma 54-interacting transcriptional regulator [Candidatus Hydrogenedentota bacterium]HNT87178.1 sigma 54-interacting transcriptional regulator [Candidatus Hydrogenedentota bacterium]
MSREYFHITVRSGPRKGSSWLIPEERLVIGRDTECDVIVADPLVSRRHCELWQTQNDVFVRDLGSRNCTLVNGRPVESCQLSVGDELCVGNVAFLLTRRIVESSGSGIRPSTSKTKQNLDSKTVYPADFTPSPMGQGLPRNVADLARLFQASRRFSTVESVAELLWLIESAICDRFKPSAVWIALSHENRLELATRPDDAGRRALSSIQTRMRKCLEERRGAIVTRRPNVAEAVSGMIAPIFIGRDDIGAIAVEGAPDAADYEESDVEFLVALCHGAAPFFGSIERRRYLERQVEQLREERHKGLRMIGSSEAMQRLLFLIGLVAKADQTTLILGETGTGKELVANLIHEMSERAQGPFVPVNCAAIPSELFESELFGHEEGAFTGAVGRKIGLLEQSKGGTILLDEIGDLSLNHQARILRAIEMGQFRRVGGGEEVQVNLRVLAATNRDLDAAVAAGTFRSDLHFRLRVLEVRVPPLRERVSDIPELAQYFLEAASSQTRGFVRGFTTEAIEFLKSHTWPGNVRELKHLVEAAAMLTEGEQIEMHTVKNLMGRSLPEDAPLSLAEVERRHIQRVLSYCNGNVPEAARILGIGRSTLYERLNQGKGV